MLVKFATDEIRSSLAELDTHTFFMYTAHWKMQIAFLDATRIAK